MQENKEYTNVYDNDCLTLNKKGKNDFVTLNRSHYKQLIVILPESLPFHRPIDAMLRYHRTHSVAFHHYHSTSPVKLPDFLMPFSPSNARSVAKVATPMRITVIAATTTNYLMPIFQKSKITQFICI